jgi:hypothetical protein
MTRNRSFNCIKPDCLLDLVGGTCAARTAGIPERQPDGQILDIMVAEGVATEAMALPIHSSFACSVARSSPIAHRQKIRGHSMPIARPAGGAV